MRERVLPALLALVIVLSSVAGGIAVAPGLAPVGTAEAAPAGMTTVPTDQISSDLPPHTPMGQVADRLREQGILASNHSASLEVIVTSPGRAKNKYTAGAVFGSGPIAIVLRDDQHDVGRRVAIPRQVLEDVLGYTPHIAYGTHENGSTYLMETTVKEQYVVIDIPHFSTNTVTWTGLFTIEGQPAIDGSTWTYNQSTQAANYTIDVTGVTSTEWDNQSAGSLANGDTFGLNIAGNAPPTGPSANGDPTVTFTGTQSTGSRYTPSGTGDVTGVTIHGDTAPSGPASGEPQITFTGNGQTTAETVTATGFSNLDTKSITVDGNLPAENEQVTFTGNEKTTARTISQTAAGDGATKSISVGGNEPTLNGQVTFTGNEYTGSQTTASGSDGGAIDPAGNVPPVGPSANNEPEITFIGHETSTQDDYSATGVSPTTTRSISVDGNIQPTDGSGGDPEISITAHESSVNYNPVNDEGDGTIDSNYFELAGSSTGIDSEIMIKPSKSGTLQSLTFNDRGEGHQYVAPDVYIIPEAPDGNYTDGSAGTLIFSGEWGDGTISNIGYKVTAGQPYTIQFKSHDEGTYIITLAVDNSGPGSWTTSTSYEAGSGYADVTANIITTPSNVVVDDNNGHSITFGDFAAGETKSASLNLQTSSTEIDFSGSGGTIDYTLTMQENFATEDPAVDINNDGTNDATYNGILASGETATVELAGLDSTSQTVDTLARTAGPASSWDITYSAHHITEDPSLDLNGDGTPEVSYSGLLQGGATQTYTVNLQPGSYTATTNLNGYTVDWSWSFDEHYITEDPALDVNGDGTADASYSGLLQGGSTVTRSVSLTPGSYTTETTLTGHTVDWTLDYTEVTATEDPAVDVTGDGAADVSYNGVLRSGETATKQLAALTEGTHDISTTVAAGPQPDWTITYDAELYSHDPAIDVNGDGTMDAAYNGMLSPGQTATFALPNLSVADDTATISIPTGQVDAAVHLKERTQSVDPTVTVNSYSTSYLGTLADGTTASLTTNTSWVQQGENTVTVSVSEGVSTDAPTPKVGLYYAHDGVDNSLVSYTGTKFSETYNVSKTFAKDQSSASLSLEFVGPVVGIRSVETRVNGGTWSDTSNWVYSNGSVTVHLGSVTAGDTVGVRIVGSKVTTYNGAIQVLEPTLPSESLDTKVEVTQRGTGDLKIGVEGTDAGRKLHYVYKATWSTIEAYSYYNDGQKVIIPNADLADTFRIATVPITLDPEGDVGARLVENDLDPTVKLTPGTIEGQTVRLTYDGQNVDSGETWIVYSKTLGHQVAKDTAESPLVFTVSDDVGLIEIRPETDGGTVSSSDGGGGIGGVVHRVQEPVSIFGLLKIPLGVLAIGALVIGVVIVLGRRRSGGGLVATTRAGANRLETVVRIFRANQYATLALAGIALLAGVATGLIPIGGQFGTIALAAILIVGGYVVLKQVGYWNPKIYAAAAALVAIWALSAVSPRTLEWIYSGLKPALPLLGIAGVYLAYRAIQAWRAPDKEVTLEISALRSE